MMSATAIAYSTLHHDARNSPPSASGTRSFKTAASAIVRNIIPSVAAYEYGKMKFAPHVDAPHMLSATKKSTATPAAIVLRRRESQRQTAMTADCRIPRIV